MAVIEIYGGQGSLANHGKTQCAPGARQLWMIIKILS